MPDWLPLFRELGSFGLIAFIVWYYATKVAPRVQESFLAAAADARAAFIAAESQARADYLKASTEARNDYLLARAEDRQVLDSLVKAIHEIAITTREHVIEARSVWSLRGDLDKTLKQPNAP